MPATATASITPRNRDDYGRRVDLHGQAPLCVYGGFKIATETWVRGEDGWECDYDIISHVVYPTAEECWAAILGGEDHPALAGVAA